MTDTPIGIFAFGTSPIDHMPGDRTRALLAEAALQGARLMLFSTADCDPGHRCIHASRWTRQGWIKEQADLPKVVMIITNPISERHHQIDRWLRRSTRVVGFHNHSKVEFAELLRASPWAEYLIPTAKLTTESLRDDLLEWLNGGGTVIKPVDGNRGVGIHFAVPDGGGWLLRRESRAWRGTLSDIVARLESNIQGRMRYRDYIAQRYIASCDTDGRPAAIRVDIMWRPAGGWEVFRIACRIASPTAFVGNLKLGGTDGYIEPFLARRSVRNPIELQEEAVALAKGAADTLNAKPGTEPNFAYGVDLAIDRDDRLWLIEANGQPQSSRFRGGLPGRRCRRPGLSRRDWRVLRLDYCRFQD